MESSTPSGKTSEPPSYRGANFFGTLIALLTLTIPFLAVGYSSSTSDPNSLAPPTYSLRQDKTK